MAVQLVMIGGSAGSLEVILELLPGLNANLSFPVVIVLHRRSVTPLGIESLLSYKTDLKVREIEDKMPMKPGEIFIAPVDYHLLVEAGESFALDLSEKVHYSRPSIDVALESACDVYGENMCGILLSGANTDGAEGMSCIAGKGAMVAIQEPSSCLVDVMPMSVKKLLPEIKSLLPSELAFFINNLSSNEVSRGR